MVGVTEEIVVTLVVAVTVAFPIPLHPTVVPVTEYAHVLVTTILFPVAPLLQRYVEAPVAVSVVVPALHISGSTLLVINTTGEAGLLRLNDI